MHELSVAGAMIEIVQRHAAGRKVTKVEVKVGHLRQVVPSALTFAFELLSAGTNLEGAELVTEEVPVTVRCHDCGAETIAQQFPLRCGECGEMNVEVVAGEELFVDAIEVEEPDEPEATLTTGGMAHGW